MIDFLASSFIGWPAILITVILAIAGLLRSNYRFLVAAAILAVPFSWSLSGFPIVRSPAFLLPLLIFSSGYCLYRDWEMLAWLLITPYLLTLWLLLNAVASS